MSRVTVAVVCDLALGSRIVDGLLARLRSPGRPAISTESTRRLAATAAFEAALPFANRARSDAVASQPAAGLGDLPHAVLGRLRPIARVVLVLRELEHMGFDDIGRVVGMDTGSVATALFRARRALGEALATVEHRA